MPLVCQDTSDFLTRLQRLTCKRLCVVKAAVAQLEDYKTVMKIEVANGEIIDKHTILVIKSERISDAGSLQTFNEKWKAR